jgi:hypothetical protein
MTLVLITVALIVLVAVVSTVRAWRRFQRDKPFLLNDRPETREDDESDGGDSDGGNSRKRAS